MSEEQIRTRGIERRAREITKIIDGASEPEFLPPVKFGSSFLFDKIGRIVKNKLTGKEAILSDNEHVLLKALLAEPGKSIPREELQYLVLGNDSGSGRQIDNAVSRLNKKLTDTCDTDSPVAPIRSSNKHGYLISSE